MADNLQEQLDLFEKIRATLPPHRSLVDEVADVLDMGTDGVYRRARGETPLKFDEALKLSRFFNVSLDEINQQQIEDAMLFRRSGVKATEDGILGYLKNLTELITNIHGKKPQKLIYASKDIPAFHLFQFPTLTLFKMFFWQKTIFEAPQLQGQKFDLKEVSEYEQTCLDLCRRISEKYSLIPSIEIWNEESTYSIIRQIQYYYESGFLGSKEALWKVIEEAELSFQHLREEATKGYKFLYDKPPKERQENYILYYNDLMLIDNLIYVQSDTQVQTFVIYHNIEYLETDNPQFCQSIRSWLETLTRRSDLISTISERQRNQFFMRIEERMDGLKQLVGKR